MPQKIRVRIRLLLCCASVFTFYQRFCPCLSYKSLYFLFVNNVLICFSVITLISETGFLCNIVTQSILNIITGNLLSVLFVLFGSLTRKNASQHMISMWWSSLLLQLSSGTAFPGRTPPRPGTSEKLPGHHRWSFCPSEQPPQWSDSRPAAATQHHMDQKTPATWGVRRLEIITK